jgi:nucleotide-binding universal stress UspA family protein
MPDVLTPAASDDQLQRVGGVVAAALDATLRWVAPSGECLADAVLRALAEPTSSAAVLRPGNGGWGVVSRATKPVVLVPAGVVAVRPRIERVLAPLDGTPEAAVAVVDAARFATRDLIVLHVFDTAVVPAFWDQAAHAGQAWGDEFLARWCDRPGTELTLRDGSPARWVPEVARTERADLIVLGWSRNLDPERAATVRGTVAQASVPVLLVPVDVTETVL